jgi:pimeloyl-ACP methyl ester carboxylesterase
MHVEHDIEYRGFRYRYRLYDNAQSDWVIILGGALQSLNSWNRYADGYQPLFNVAVCDLPGMGESDVLPHGYPIEFLSDCLKHIVDRERMGAVFLHSVYYGTPIAYTFSVKYPGSVSQVILAATMREIPNQIRDQTEYSIKLIQSGRLDQASDLFGRMFMACDQLDAIENGELALKLLKRGVLNLSPRRQINYVENSQRLLDTPPMSYREGPDIPFLIFTGEFDPYTRAEGCREIASRLPHATFTAIQHTDHLANLEAPDTVWQLCSRFFMGGDPTTVPGCSAHHTGQVHA